ncbi:6-phosphofructokinase [bacterium]|nr:6-phosphofructokinase [bacterium]
MKQSIQRIGVLTTGGDASGMNPAIRAVVRTALGMGIETMGIRRGNRGLYEGDAFKMNARTVGGIINFGGTILKTKRFPEFREKQVRQQAYKNVKRDQLDGLVIIGGDGSARGAYEIHSEFGVPVVLIPASIDNDVYGTDFTLGFDTAVNNAVDAVDKIRDTAHSHNRTFIVEVMGKEKGNLALEVAIACGAEIVLVPEIEADWNKVFTSLEDQKKRGKVSSLIILAEGAGKAQNVAKLLEEKFPEREIRFSVLGHIQRGGNPSAFSRSLATKFGVEAVKMLRNGFYSHLVGYKDGQINCIPLQEVISNQKTLPMKDVEILDRMAT